jgi:hypothetical protein
MIIDLEEAIGKVGAAGCGSVEQQEDGTWLAFVFVDDGDQGFYALGATEGHALQALEAKCKALGGLLSAAYAEAECRYRARKQAEERKMMTDLLDSLKGEGRPSPFDLPADKKAKPEGGN